MVNFICGSGEPGIPIHCQGEQSHFSILTLNSSSLCSRELCFSKTWIQSAWEERVTDVDSKRMVRSLGKGRSAGGRQGTGERGKVGASLGSLGEACLELEFQPA